MGAGASTQTAKAEVPIAHQNPLPWNTNTSYKQTSVHKWSVSQVLAWVYGDLSGVLDGGEPATADGYTAELCRALALNKISGALLVYMADVQCLSSQLQLDTSRWATRLHYVAACVKELGSSSANTVVPTTVQVLPRTTPAALSGAVAKPLASNKKRFAVISYSTKQCQFKDWVCEYVRSKLGIEAWSGQDVLPGAGGGYWAEQWQAKADDEACVLIIFVLSRAFAQSQACKTELLYVFNSSKVTQVLPVMYEEFAMPKWLSWNLCTVNFVTVTPFPAKTCCRCKAKCECTLDCRQQDPGLAPDSNWHEIMLQAAASIAMLTTGQGGSRPGTGTQAQGDPGAPSPPPPPSLAPAPLPPPAPSVEDRRKALLADIAREAGMSDVGRLKLIGVIGSVKFYCEHTAAICQAIGERLAALGEDYVLVTGGFFGVGEAIANAFHAAVARRQAEGGGKGQRLFQVLPETDPALHGVTDIDKCPLKEKAPLEMQGGRACFADWPVGKVLRVGASVREREGVMACLPVLLLLEGGPGATNEAKEASRSKKYVVPVAVTGGAAQMFYEEGASEGVGIAKISTGASPDKAAKLGEAWAALAPPEEGSGPLDVDRVAQCAVDLVQYLHDEVVGREGTKALAAQGSPANRAPDLTVLNPDWDSLDAPNSPVMRRSLSSRAEEQMRDSMAKYLAHFDGCYIVNGHGSRNQYKCSEEELRATLKPLIASLDEKHGKGNWCCCYGGDPYQGANVQDVSHVARVLHSEGVAIIAVQCAAYKDSILSPGEKDHYAHLSGGAVLFYPTTFQVDANGLKHIEFGGRKLAPDGSWVLVGWSRVVFSPQVLKYLKGHLVIGGGAITRDDCEQCVRHKVPLYYIRMEARNKTLAHNTANPGMPYYGEIEEWMQVRSVQDRRWQVV